MLLLEISFDAENVLFKNFTAWHICFSKKKTSKMKRDELLCCWRDRVVGVLNKSKEFWNVPFTFCGEGSILM